MNITVTSNAADVSRVLREVFADQIPFATAKALNRTAEDVQKAQREGMDDDFTLRRKRWAELNIKIGRDDRATKRKLEAAVRVESPGGGDRSDILSKFERGGRKKASDGGRIAVPVEARISKSDNLPKNKRPKAFNFKPAGTGGRLFYGERRTFMIRNPDGTGGIYQRQRSSGKGKARPASTISTRKVRDVNLRTLYRFTKTAKIDNRLHFEETARGVVIARFGRHFKVEFHKAVKSAKR